MLDYIFTEYMFPVFFKTFAVVGGLTAIFTAYSLAYYTIDTIYHLFVTRKEHYNKNDKNEHKPYPLHYLPAISMSFSEDVNITNVNTQFMKTNDVRSGDRILLRNQNYPFENGLYVYTEESENQAKLSRPSFCGTMDNAVIFSRNEKKYYIGRGIVKGKSPAIVGRDFIFFDNFSLSDLSE